MKERSYDEVERAFEEKQEEIRKVEFQMAYYEKLKQALQSEVEILRAEAKEIVSPPKFDNDGYVSSYNFQPVPNRQVEIITRSGRTEQGIASKFDYVQPIVGSEPNVASSWKYI